MTGKLVAVLGITILFSSGFFAGREIFQKGLLETDKLLANLVSVGNIGTGTLVEEIPIVRNNGTEKEIDEQALKIKEVDAKKAQKVQKTTTQVAFSGEAKKTSNQRKTATELKESVEPESPIIEISKPAQKEIEPAFCLETDSEPARSPVIINEIAWMGDTESAQHEWIELKNISSAVIPISGWQLFDKSRMIKIVMQKDAVLSAGNKFILARQSKDKIWMEEANALFSGTINNSDEELVLFDKNCSLIDRVSASPSWQAGNNETKATMERNSNLSWHSSSVIGGTPGQENSIPAVAQVSADEPDNTPPVIGNSEPPPQQTQEIQPPAENAPLQTTRTGKILISEIMAGAEGDSDYDFVEIYNDSDAAVDLTGWTLKKKSSSGSESSLVSASRLEGKSILSDKRLLFANASSSIQADVFWPKSYSLAYTNNSVVIYNASGEKIDETGWAEIPKGQSYERTLWTSDMFVIQVSPTPQNSQMP